MRKRTKSALDQPLREIRVLVGRARHQAGALSGELRKLGANVIEIPFIEVRKPKSFGPLDAALKSLGTYDWLILTSVNGVEAMWERMEKIGEGPDVSHAVRPRESVSVLQFAEKLGLDASGAEALEEKKGSIAALKALRHPTPSFSNCLAAEGPLLRIAAIGPATRKAIEQRGVRVDVVPNEYVAESVVRSLKNKVKGKRVLLVRAKVARDVIPRELRKAGAHVDVVEAYETGVPQSSRRRLRSALKNRRPHVVTFTSSSTVRNFVDLVGLRAAEKAPQAARGRGRPRHTGLDGILMASIGPVTSSTLREFGLPVDISAQEFTIPGLVAAIVKSFAAHH